MKKKLILFSLAIGMHCQASSQSWWAEEDTSQRIRPEMFNLSPYRYNHHISVALPNDGTLHIDFLRLSDWGEHNRIGFVANTASTHVRALNDSFKNDFSTKLVAINIPIDEELISVKYAEDISNKDQLVWKNGEYYRLKTGFDTIRVIKNIGIRKKPIPDSGLIQVQYTFILKDINDIHSIAANSSLMNDIGQQIDSVIYAYRRRWSNQDLRSHFLNIKIDDDQKKSLSIRSSKGFLQFYKNHIGVSVAFGGIVFNNNIAPYFDISLAYMFPSKGNMRSFIGYNSSSFPLFKNDTYNRTYTFNNIEFGVCKKGIGLLQKKTSFTLGVVTSDYEPDRDLMLNLGVNYGINSFLSFGINTAIDFEEDPNKDQSFIGVHVKFNL